MRTVTGLALVLATLTATAAQAQVNVKIGVLTDMASLYADDTGTGSVAAPKMAIADFNPEAHGLNVDLVSADHQHKPATGTRIVRKWYDVEHVDMIADVPTSSV